MCGTSRSYRIRPKGLESMTLFSRKQSTLCFCVTIAIFLVSGVLALLLPTDAATLPEEESGSSESSASEVKTSIFTATDPTLYSEIDIGIDVGASVLDEVPYVQITVKNNSSEHAFKGTVTFHTEEEEGIMPAIELDMLAPGCSITAFLSGFEPDFEDFKSLTEGNYYDYTAGDYPPAHTLIYIDGVLSGVQMNESNLTENQVVLTTGYLMMDEYGELPISGSIGYLSQIALDLQDDTLVLDPGAVLWTGQIDLGIPIATEIRAIDSEASSESDVSGSEESDTSDEDNDTSSEA